MVLSIKSQNLDAFHIKIFALCAMTLDHIAAYIGICPWFRMIGRLSAILFLYILIDGFYNSKAKALFVLKLFIANLLMTISTAILNSIILCSKSGFATLGYTNIFGTWFTTLIIIFFLELAINSSARHRYLRSFGYVLCLALTVLIPILYLNYLYSFQPLLRLLDRLNINGTIVSANIYSCLNAILPNLLTIDYSMLFVLLGVLLYFFRNRSIHIVIILIGSTISWLGSLCNNSNVFWPCSNFFEPNQWIMVFSILLIRLYSGKVGTNAPKFKVFFYIYYPVHVYILFLLGETLERF